MSGEWQMAYLLVGVLIVSGLLLFLPHVAHHPGCEYKLYSYTVVSLLEAPCAKTSWRALLFRAILGIMGAVILCFDIWWFKQVNNSKTGFDGHHCDFGQHVPYLTVHVCINYVKFVLEAPGASILWGRFYSVAMYRLTWGCASIREGASNRDITVCPRGRDDLGFAQHAALIEDILLLPCEVFCQVNRSVF